MDLVPGGSLRDHLREHHTVPACQAARLAAQVAAALAEAHELGVVHRDLKPDNILLQTADGQLDTRLTDFGIARVLNTPSLTTPHAVVGTPHYMAPEAFHGAPTTPAADVYALGILLYELVVGRPPYDSDSVADLMRRHLEEQPERRPGIPDALWAVIVECMEKKPRLRPTAAELVDDLTAVARETADVPALPRPRGAEPVTRASAAELPRSFRSATTGGSARAAAPRHPSLPRVRHPSLPGVRRIPRRRNEAPRWRWARPGAMVVLVCGAMLASGVATNAWHVSRSERDGGTRIQALTPAVSSGAAPSATPARSRPARDPATTPAPDRSATAEASASPTGEGGRAAPESPARASVPAAAEQGVVTPAGRRAVARAVRVLPESRPYGPLQCEQRFAFTRNTPLLAKPCHSLGTGIRVMGRLAAPPGGHATVTVTLQDAASGRAVEGPRTCARLVYTEDRLTHDCGRDLRSAPRGHRYAVVLTWRYTRQGGTVQGSARGPEFRW
jgi:serine/threonine-protein kinase